MFTDNKLPKQSSSFYRCVHRNNCTYMHVFTMPNGVTYANQNANFKDNIIKNINLKNCVHKLLISMRIMPMSTGFN